MLAQQEAERLHHSYIGTEHLLLGMMLEEGGVAGRVLHDLGLEQGRVEEIVKRLTRGTTRTLGRQIDLSPGTKHVLELAVDEARRMGHHYIGTEHLLLGLVRQSDGVAIDVLKQLGISAEEVRRQVRRVLQESPAAQLARDDSARPPVPNVKTLAAQGIFNMRPMFGPTIPDASFQCDVYMMMPHLDTLQPVYDEHVKPVVESYDLTIKRADDFFSSHDMIREIWTCIFNATFVIADCTGQNANVFYELGIVHTLGKPFILLTQNINDLPFVVRGRRALVYEPTPDGLAALTEKLRLAIEQIATGTE